MLRRLPYSVNPLFMLCAIPVLALGAEVRTNSVHFKNAPPWLTEGMVERATGPVQDILQWHLRRVPAHWHSDAAEFEALAGGPGYQAFYRRADGSLHLGPQVTAANFNSVFSHELVHAISAQKYKGAIPVWLEEGLANTLAKMGPPDYPWLASQPKVDVTTLAHPSTDPTGLRFHYQTSTALTEMIQSKCSLEDLLQLSVGKKMQTYLKTYCEISDLNAAYAAWVSSKAGQDKKYKPPQKRPTPASASRSKAPSVR